MTKPTLKEKQHKLREDTIRESAMRFLTDKGFESMTMDDVANDVGISKATLYQHFKSKEELAADVVLHTIRQIEGFINAIDPAQPAIERLKLVMKWIIGRRYGDPTLDFCNAESTIKPILRRNAEFVRIDALLLNTMTDLVDEAKTDGDISKSLATPVLVQAFLSCIQGGAYYSLLREGACTMHELEETLMGMVTGFQQP